MSKIIIPTALAGIFALGLVGAVQAQTIPTPVNPTPNFPVSTNGTPLPHDNARSGDGLFTGRSVFAPRSGDGYGSAEAYGRR